MVLVSLLVATYAVFPVTGQSMKPTDLLIKMYLNPDSEFTALQTGEIDVVDWPLPKDWIDEWLDEPDIRLVDYSEMAWNELTPNHQLWPTGWRDYNEKPTICLGGELEQYDPTVQRHLDANKFNTAIAFLSNKEEYISVVMKGYGVRTDASKPATVGWISPNLIEWPYSQDAAIAMLEAGGFRDYDNDGWREWDEDRDGVGYEELPPLEFWARLDDPLRGDSADLLQAELTAVGIPVNYHKEDAWSNYLHVMFGCAAGEPLPANWPDVSHWLSGGEWMEGMKRFHLYTSGWIATSPTQDQYRDLYVASMATEGYMLFSTNYGGFWVGDGELGTPDDAYDYEYYAKIAKFGVEEDEVKEGVYRCQEIAQEFWPVYPWFSSVSVKAYRHNEGPDDVYEWDYSPGVDDTGWFGAVNHANLGPDFAASNAFAFTSMYNPTDSTLDWGFKTEPFTLNTITAQWLYESNVLNLMYEPLILHTPWELTQQYGWLAEPMAPGPDGEYGTPTNPAAYYDDVWAEPEIWLDPDGSTSLDPPVLTGDERMAITLRLREGATFHNGDPVTAEDVKFNSLFQRDCGTGVSFGWSTYEFMEYVDIQADDPSLGPRDIKWYFSISTYWLLYYAGYTGPINRNIWLAANTNNGWNYRWPRGSGVIVDSWVDAGKLYVRTSAHPGNPCQIEVSEDVYIAGLDPENPTYNLGPYHVDSKIADGDTWIFDLTSAEAPIAPVPKYSRLDEFPGEGSGWDPTGIIEYQPWIADQDGDGDVDLKEDSTGPWVFESWVGGETILLSRYPTPEMGGGTYYKTEAEIRGFLVEAFHRAGNTNYEGANYESEYVGIGKPPDMSIRMMPDGMYLARAVGTDDGYPHGTGFMKFNADTDYDRDGEVWVIDYVLRFGRNYGKDAG